MRVKFKPWAEPYIKEHPEASLDIESDLPKLDQFYLDIGSGKGEFLAKMATRFPNLTFIGVEKNVTCAGISTKRLVESEITNAKLIWADFERISAFIKDESVKIIFLNFSDPWPKVRHHKRRLTSNRFLEEYKRILTKDGKLIFKTDNVDLFDYSLETFSDAGFKVISVTRDYRQLDEFDELTDYEECFRKEGTPINRVVLSK